MIVGFVCRHCGRNIDGDHNLGRFNLERHEDSCLDQQRREAERAMRRASREYRRQFARSVKKSGVGIVPGVGQLGFGFAGVPEEVKG